MIDDEKTLTYAEYKAYFESRGWKPSTEIQYNHWLLILAASQPGADVTPEEDAALKEAFEEESESTRDCMARLLYE